MIVAIDGPAGSGKSTTGRAIAGLQKVSGGSLNYLWLLARTPQLRDEELQPMLHCAEELGYDTSQLIYSNSLASTDNGIGRDL